MVRELKLKDKNFETESAALRHYASVGIAAETATSDLRNSLDNTIVKKSIKQAAHDEITLLKKDLEEAVDLIRKSAQKNTEDFADLARRTDFIESKVERVLEASKIMPREPAPEEASSPSAAKIAAPQKARQDARQTVILKSIFNAFYIAQTDDRIPATENGYMRWANALNKETHDRVNALPPKELMSYANPAIEPEKLRAFAKQIVNQVALN